MRKRPEQPTLSIEMVKEEIDAESEEQLGIIREQLQDLFKSLVSIEQGSIRNIYNRILDEQAGTVPNKLLIDQLKLELLGAFIPHYNKLSASLNFGFLPRVVEYFTSRKLNLKSTAETMHEQIINFMSQELTSKIMNNAFRVSVWRDNIDKTINYIDALTT